MKRLKNFSNVLQNSLEWLFSISLPNNKEQIITQKQSQLVITPFLLQTEKLSQRSSA